MHTRMRTVAQGSGSECSHQQGGRCMTLNSLTLEVTGHGFTFRCCYAAVTEAPQIQGRGHRPLTPPLG